MAEFNRNWQKLAEIGRNWQKQIEISKLAEFGRIQQVSKTQQNLAGNASQYYYSYGAAHDNVNNSVYNIR